MRKEKISFKNMLLFIRPGISGMVTAACFFGYVIKKGAVDVAVLNVMFGVFLLSSGCSMLNQVQEFNIDKKMERTKKRPIPMDFISRKIGFIISILVIFLSFVIFSLSTNPINLLILAILTIIIYNGIYTPLKMITPFALLIGAIMGSFPPFFGYIEASGNFFDKEIIAIGICFFLWQTPHFWLLLESHKSEYLKAGFPVLFTKISDKTYYMLIKLWIISFGISLMLLPLFIKLPIFYSYLLTFVSILFIVFETILKLKSKIQFHVLNFTLLICLVIIMVGKFNL